MLEDCHREVNGQVSCKCRGCGWLRERRWQGSGNRPISAEAIVRLALGVIESRDAYKPQLNPPSRVPQSPTPPLYTRPFHKYCRVATVPSASLPLISLPDTTSTLLSSYTPKTTMVKPTTCCGRSDTCVCAQKATCSCGKQSAMNCSCEKKATENTLQGARCSCSTFSPSPRRSWRFFRVADDSLTGARPAGQCTCDRASSENATPSGNTCACGQRSAGSCTCEKAADGGLLPDETDFTGKA